MVTHTPQALKLESRHPHLVTVSTGLDFGIGIYTIREGMTRVGLKECLDPPQVRRSPAPRARPAAAASTHSVCSLYSLCGTFTALRD